MRQSFGAKHGVIPAAAQDPIIARMFGCVFAQLLLNIGSVLRAFEIHTAKTERAIQKMNVAIGESGEYEFSAGIDNLGAHAAHFLDGGIVANRHNSRSVNSHGLRPRLFCILRVNTAVNHDDVCRFDDEALRSRQRDNPEEKQKKLKREANSMVVHRSAVLFQCRFFQNVGGVLIHNTQVSLRPGFFQRCGVELSK